MYNGCCSHIVRATPISPPVAKLDIAVDSDSKGRGFESLRAGQSEKADKPSVFKGLSAFLLLFCEVDFSKK